MVHRRRLIAGASAAVVAAAVALTCTVEVRQDHGHGAVPPAGTVPAGGTKDPEPESSPGAVEKAKDRKQGKQRRPETKIGAFLGSGPEGVRRIPQLERWLGGRTELDVGHTYLPGDLWVNIEGRPRFLEPWAKWRKAEKDRLFVLNVPMLERNEAGVPDRRVRQLLDAGARGAFDRHFRTLGRRLVDAGVPDTVVVLGWEMNGTTYTHRCGPHPEAWKAYWRRIVDAMREAEGQRFRFDFAPSRGRDAIPWTRCYPGDRYVDVIGMDSYDQPPGETFEDQVEQPYGLQDQVDFARAHGKPISYPEWGLFRNGDNAAYMHRMMHWIREQRPLYHTLTDYCPHGVWWCRENEAAGKVFRALVPRNRLPEPGKSGARPPAGRPGSPQWKPASAAGDGWCVNVGDWAARWLGGNRVCLRVEDRS